MTATKTTVTSLTCEYTVNPLGIDAADPRLSWVLESPERGARQTAYQILVARTREALDQETGDLWDTGRVDSEQSAQVAYAGKPLGSRQRAWWKVRVWDADGAASVYSEPAFWEMGLLRFADWGAKWIYAGNAFGDAAPLFRKGFQVARPVRRARAYVSAAGYYELYLNGNRVGDRVLDPAFTQFDKRLLYSTYDVTDLLNQGANAVGAVLGNGFYNCQHKDAWNFDTAAWRDAPKLIAQLYVEYEDGSAETIVTDQTWKMAAGPTVYNSVRTGERYDARQEKAGWDTASFGGPDWAPARIAASPGGLLQAQMGPPCRVMQTITPAGVREVKPGVFIVDMGQNLAGWMQLTVEGSTGTEVVMRFAEKLGEDGDIDAGNINTLVTSDHFSEDHYVLKGEGVEVWEPRFVYHGFRWAQVTGFPGTPTVQNFRGRVVHTAFERAGQFSCSNELLNEIQRCTLWSFIGNFVGIPTDCPHREKNGWMGDAHLAAEQALLNFHPPAAYTKWLDDIEDAMRPSGQLPGIVPTSGWGYNWGNGPAWDSASVLIPWYLYLYEGDLRILERHYPMMRRYVDYMTLMSVDGIADFGLGDWCPPTQGAEGHESPSAVTGTGYYHRDARIVARTAELLGKAEEAERYTRLADEVKAAFNARFYDAAGGRYADGGQTSQSCALYQGLTPEQNRGAVVARLVQAVDEHDGHLWCGILGTKYLLHALTMGGHADVAYGVATKKDYPSWGLWLEQGATTLWESWQGGDSRNHIMFGDISAWFYRALAGINPDPACPGFKHTIIKPHVVGDLTWVSAEHRTPYGVVKVHWRKEGGRLSLDVTVPPNSTATLHLPAVDPNAVTESGAPASQAQGVVLDRAVDGRAVYRLASGAYRFEA